MANCSAMPLAPQPGLVLGIDLGSNSLGTVLVHTGSQQIPFMGVRIFPAGVTGDLEEGKEESCAATRRQARLARRQTQRRHRRLVKIFRRLQRMGLLPPGERTDTLARLDRELARRYPDTTVLPWLLRARALDHPLEPYELGRALYHLAQRRGFISNRVGGKQEDEKERSTVKASIKGLDAAIGESGKRTLGEYMASLPQGTKLRNSPEDSNRYTHRSMFQYEFALIWDCQRIHHPSLLTDRWRATIEHALFHQRPLRDQSHLVGECELEPSEKRAPLRLLACQRFRVLEFVNNLRLRCSDGSERKLTPNERATLLDLSERRDSLTLAAARSAIGARKTDKFTIEEGGEKNLPVNLTVTRLRSALGSFWDDLSPEQRADLVEDVGDGKRCPTDEDLERCGREKWALPPDLAGKLAAVRLPDAYGRFSLKALTVLLPRLEQGITIEEAIRDTPAYAQTRRTAEPLPSLPPVKDMKAVLGEIRNPAVMRALTELRKTVNAIVRRFGLPERIHVELARDLKKTRKERQNETKRNRDREKLRQEAVAELRKHDSVRFANPRGADIEKYMLAKEAGMRCPYTGRQYGFTDVFGDHPQVDIEHIIPRSRSLDDSFNNKTLAYRSANMEKGTRTPREWLYESDPDRYQQMLSVVKGFDARFDSGPKLRRFTLEAGDPDSLLAEFTQRQLQDTRYASKLACQYLGTLYGGTTDATGTQRVFACAGQVTAKLRRAWDLNLILSPDKPEKSRDDHRHHAVDALTVAMSSSRIIRDLATAAGEADRLYRRKIILPVPWIGFAGQAREKVEAIVPSHRPLRKLSGALHEETLYSPPRKTQVGTDKKGRPVEKQFVHYRVPVTSLKTAADFESIVDPVVREAVRKKAEALGAGGDRFLGNWPVLVTRDGREIPIRRVRRRKVQSVVPIGKGARERFVIPGANHHSVIFAEIGSSGEITRYLHETVTLLEAVERKRLGAPVVHKEIGPAYRFVCTLSEGDLIEARRPADPSARIWKVRSVRESGQFSLTPALDARPKNEIEKSGQVWSPAVNPLFCAGARKVIVSALGEVIAAND
jgi:CRISPR-associated endonuclease Csn1